MSRQNDTNNAPLSLDMIDEDRVRRALGLKTGGGGLPHQQRPEQARQRHRFVADGAVPVVMLNRTDSETSSLKDRLGAVEHQLEQERNAHAGTKRALSEAQAARQALQTRLGHLELSQNEGLRAERSARQAADETVTSLRAELAALRAELATQRSEHEAALKAVREAAAAAAAPTATPVRVRRPIRAAEPIPRQKRASAEPKPVRWWTPSYRAKQR